MLSCHLAAACSRVGQKIAPPWQSATRKSYLAEYERWTRHGRAEYDVVLALEVWVTYASLAWREAYVAEQAESYGWSAEKRRSAIEEQRRDDQRVFAYHVVAQSHDERWARLDQPKSPWRIIAVPGPAHAELRPLAVKKSDLLPVVARDLFPRPTPFGRDFEVTFERGAVATPRVPPDLLFTGPLGRISLSWLPGP